MTQLRTFPKNFKWGVSTSAYQIEGGVHEGGRGESIWDVFSHIPGKTLNNDTGDEAADSYHRWPEDLALIKMLGVSDYRFSIAWPRIQPTGRGPVNEAGMAYYERIVDDLLKAGIEPMITLFHWDMPSALPGVWLNRDTCQAFADYADVVTRRLGDRVKMWTTINEPFCASIIGYAFGEHAPGEKNFGHALIAAHYVQLAHGMAVPVIRANVPEAVVSLVVNPTMIYPATASAADREASRFHDGVINRWLMDAQYGKGYPSDMVADFKRMGIWQEFEPVIRPGDMETIAAPTDLLGVNYYSPHRVAADEAHPELPELGHMFIAPGTEVTDFDWEVYPQALPELLSWVMQTYAPKRLLLAENGASYHDGPGADGQVHDTRRVSYLRRHLNAIADAIQQGSPVEGYFCWSLLDNFEWAAGYSQRFGLVHVDFATKKRTPKDSAYFFQQVIAANAVEE
jgi:beta-glucosidase